MSTNTFEVHSGDNVTLTTTAETVVATLDGVATGRAANVRLYGWAQLTTGAATTTVTPRIRRGTAITGTLIDEGNPVTIGAAAGGTEEFSLNAVDEALDASGVSYVYTLQQAAATGNGTSLQASLRAEVTR